MFWIFIALASFALTFAKLGAVSVLAKILGIGLHLAVILIVGLLILLTWQRIGHRS